MRKLFCLLCVTILCIPAVAQNAAEKANESLAKQTRFDESALSPDGRYLAWVEGIRDPSLHEARNSAIYLSDLQSGSKRRVTTGDGKTACAENHVVWSSDNEHFAFLSNCADAKQAQLYLGSASENPPQVVTKLTGHLSDPRWSPDAKTIAILFVENAKRETGPLVPSAKDAGVVEEHIEEQRIALIDVATKAVRIISPSDTYVYELDWSRDSRRLAYTAAKGSGDNNWWVAELFTIDAASGTIQHVLKPDAQIAVPRFSPDGQEIAFISGIMSDEGSTGGDILSVNASGGKVRNLTPGRKASPNWLEWLPSKRILFTETVDGSSAIGLLNPDSGTPETLWRGDESLRAGMNALSVASDGKTVACIRSGWAKPPEVWSGPIGEWKARTDANSDQKPVTGKAEKLHWTSDRASVQGWLIYPTQFDSTKKYPLIVMVHGGPAAAVKPRWPAEFDNTLLASEGYFLLLPNPRGSYGAGEAFTKGNIKDFGYGDLRDINAGVDAALKSFPIDPKRVGITGWSYGGFMTMWTVTQTNRFHAAVAGAGISNWQSYYGENLIDQWMIPYFGASVYADPQVYARSSPITFIKNVRTPTLILVGDSDAECPAPQSYEFWHALKTLGVKTQFVVYPNEGHGIRLPEHKQDLMRRLIGWFNENLAG